MQQERIWIVKASLGVTAAVLLFFISAPGLLGFPLDYDQSIRITQIITPVFVGYIGLATAFLFGVPNEKLELPVQDQALMRLLLRGPVYMMGGGLIVVVATFWYTNRRGGPPAA